MKFLKLSALVLGLFLTTNSYSNIEGIKACSKSREDVKYILSKKGAKSDNIADRRFHLTKDALVWCLGKLYKGKLKYNNIKEMNIIASKRPQVDGDTLKIELKKAERGRKVLEISDCSMMYGMDRKCKGSVTELENELRGKIK